VTAAATHTGDDHDGRDDPGYGASRMTALAVSPRPPSPPPPMGRPVPSLVERQQAVLCLFGDDALSPGLPSFRTVLVHEVERLFDSLVLPTVRACWPHVDQSPFLTKWKAGYILYCGLGLSTIVCSRRRPRLVDLASRGLRAMSASESVIVGAAHVAIPVVFRVLERRLCERAALGAAWILVLDEALDDDDDDDDGHGGDDVETRASELRRALRGECTDTASVALQTSAAMARALRQRCDDADDHAALDDVIAHIEAWIDGEVASVAGVPDPTGTSFRMAGVAGSMEVLLWAVRRYAGDVEREFLCRIAELGQIADDWLDIDKDEAQGRMTPATTGAWTIDDMARVFARAGGLLDELAAQAGEPHGAPFHRLLVRTFRGEVQRMARTLVENP
jgi:hypothetical protein